MCCCSPATRADRQFQQKEVGLSIRRRGGPAGASAPPPAAGTAGEEDGPAPDAAVDLSSVDEHSVPPPSRLRLPPAREAGGTPPALCDSCGSASSPSWNSTAVSGMTLCQQCCTVLGMS
jgi:hypothetical protein